MRRILIFSDLQVSVVIQIRSQQRHLLGGTLYLPAETAARLTENNYENDQMDQIDLACKSQWLYLFALINILSLAERYNESLHSVEQEVDSLLEDAIQRDLDEIRRIEIEQANLQADREAVDHGISIINLVEIDKCHTSRSWIASRASQMYHAFSWRLWAFYSFASFSWTCLSNEKSHSNDRTLGKPNVCS